MTRRFKMFKKIIDATVAFFKGPQPAPVVVEEQVAEVVAPVVEPAVVVEVPAPVAEPVVEVVASVKKARKPRAVKPTPPAGTIRKEKVAPAKPPTAPAKKTTKPKD
jgi:hypothetical protein